MKYWPVHLVVAGAVACGVSLTAEQFRVRTTKVAKRPSCRRCRAAAKRIAAARVVAKALAGQAL